MAWQLIGPAADLMPPQLELPQVPSSGMPATPLFLDLAVAALRHAPLVILIVLHLSSVGVAGAESAEDEEKCSKGLGFNASHGPKDRHAQDLNFCNEHHKRTCCEKEHTRQVLGKFAAFSFERSARCVQMTRLALCSVCDADVGVGRKARLNNVLLCPSFCKQWFQSCLEDFFAPSGSGDLQPCGPSSLVCSPLNEITEDSAAFCSKAGGFSVAASEDDSDACYDGIPAARSRGSGPRAKWVRPEPIRPPWWRRWLDSLRDLQYRLPRSLPRSMEKYLPGIIVASILVFFGGFVILRGD